MTWLWKIPTPSHHATKSGDHRRCGKADDLVVKVLHELIGRVSQTKLLSCQFWGTVCSV